VAERSTANAAFYRALRTTSEETENRSLFALGSHQWDNSKLRGLLQDVLNRGDSFEGLEVEYNFPTIGPRIVLLHGRRLQARGLGSDLVLLAMRLLAAVARRMVAASDGYRGGVGASAQRALRLPGHCGWGHVGRVSEQGVTRKRTPGLSCDSTSLFLLQLAATKSPTRVLELLLMP
jgi:hypothetical protein